VALVDQLWLAALTRNELDAGLGPRNRFNLTVNVDGNDVADQDVSGTARREVLREGNAILSVSRILPTPFESKALTNSSIRLGIRGDDAWGPQHVLVLGRTQPDFEPAQIIALAMATDLTDWLSTDSSEGKLTMPIRLVGSGSSTTLIRRVLLLVRTSGGGDTGTDSPIRLEITAGGSSVLQQRIEDTQQDDLEKSTANWYFLDEVVIPFTRGDVVSNGGISLSILDEDAWLPKRVFVFGLDTLNGPPNEVVDLVSIPGWDLGWLSTDAHEGKSSVPLPVVSV
jgi:hypothetical protein